MKHLNNNNVKLRKSILENQQKSIITLNLINIIEMINKNW